MPTNIDWCDEVWNPVTGCTKISPGCDHCYAERMSKRLAGRCGYPRRAPFKIAVHKNRMDLPMTWKKPRSIFVNSMGDLFHPDVPVSAIFDVLGVIEREARHTFLILTKRPEWMFGVIGGSSGAGLSAPPLRNLWLGVTVENQEQAAKRIPTLQMVPAAVRFVSVEPMLGPVDLLYSAFNGADSFSGMAGIDWVICGGETGPGARPMHADWVRSLRDQCQQAGVPFFFKGWGSWWKDSPDGSGDNTGKKLDGREWREFPKKK